MGWYTGDAVFDTILAIALSIPPMAAVALLFMRAPYGRFGSDARVKVGARLGWFLMELPATVVFYAAYLSGPRRGELVPMILAGIWSIHYVNRGFVFPYSIRAPKGSGGNFGVLVLVSGMFVTALHGYLNGTYFARLGPFEDRWLSDPRFLAGVAIYFGGLALNVHSDAVLRRLRTPAEIARGEKVYRIPMGGGFRMVTSPSYLGELIMWTGFSLFTWSLPGVFILAISAANLIPRAVANHRWYKEKFTDYPRDRRALIPFLL